MDFKGKVAVITGAASGIGKETAILLGKRGASLILADIQEKESKKLLVDLKSKRIEADFLMTDVSDVRQIQVLFSKTLALHKKLDILVNCAGICYLTPVPEITPEEWDKILSINLRSVFFCCQAALKFMCGKKYGKIVNLASAAGKIGGVAAGAHYAASKAAIICVTKSLAIFAAAYGVNVNCVCPGPTDTPMTESWGKEINTSFADSIPFKRYGKPEEVAEAICFLASDRAAYITGETLDVNGGLIMD